MNRSCGRYKILVKKPLKALNRKTATFLFWAFLFYKNMELTNFNSERKFSSLFLVEQINLFRKEENVSTDLRHSDFLRKIEKEFEDEIVERKISLSSYLAGNGKQEKCYDLTFEQSLQILMNMAFF